MYGLHKTSYMPQVALKYVRVIIFSIIIMAAPFFIEAKVLINEIAWMGTTQSANDEWIEFFNDGDRSVSLDGWMLTDSQLFVVKLAGTVGPGELIVLERTDDSTVEGVAFLIYKGALSNSGRTLTLLNKAGTLVDEVVGGDGWTNIGGNNKTKFTAQRNGDAWTSALPTPGTVNLPPVVDNFSTSTETEQFLETQRIQVAAVGEISGETLSMRSILSGIGLVFITGLGTLAIYARRINKED